MKIKLSKSKWQEIGKQAGWNKQAYGYTDFDENTQMVGKISSVEEAKKICKKKFNHLPKPGIEILVDTGTIPIKGEEGTYWAGTARYKYKTWLVNEAGKFRVWTWIDVNRAEPEPEPKIESVSAESKQQIKQAQDDRAQMAHYRRSQIDGILEPETKFGYRIKLSNGESGAATNFMNLSKEELLAIQKILG